MLYLHDLKGKIPTTIALQYFYIGQAVFNSVAMMFQEVDFKKIEVDFTFFLAVTGMVIFAYATQNLVTRAMMLKKPSHIMPLGYIAILVSTLTDKILFGNDFTFLTICGMLLTSSGLLIKLMVPEDAKIVTETIISSVYKPS
jgi:drug/metabolite transporter (DMT)-like permease